MSEERGFDLQQEQAPGERPTPAQGTPAPRRGPARGAARTARRGREPEGPQGPGRRGRLAFLISPTFFLALGALLTLGLWLGQLNPKFGALANVWPWDLFRAQGPDGGDPFFHWDRYRAFAISVAVFTLCFVIAAIARPGRGRGLFVLAVCFLAFATFLQPGANMYYYAGVACFALLGGAILAREGVLGGRGGRALLLVALVFMAGQLFFPHPRIPVDQAEMLRVDPSAYRSIALTLRTLVEPPPDSTVLDVLLEPGLVNVIGMALLFLVGLLSLLGLGGRWALWTGGLVVLLTTLLPLALLFRQGWLGSPESTEPLSGGLAVVAVQLQSRFTAFLLPLAAAIADLARPRGA